MSVCVVVSSSGPGLTRTEVLARTLPRHQTGPSHSAGLQYCCVHCSSAVLSSHVCTVYCVITLHCNVQYVILLKQCSGVHYSKSNAHCCWCRSLMSHWQHARIRWSVKRNSYLEYWAGDECLISGRHTRRMVVCYKIEKSMPETW